VSAAVEAVLVYRPRSGGIEKATPVEIGSTSDPEILHTLRNRLIAQSEETTRMMRNKDLGLSVLSAGERERLILILDFLLPEATNERELSLVEELPEPAA
jgi:hypothetical protein